MQSVNNWYAYCKKNNDLVFLRHGVHVQFRNTCAIDMVILSTPKSPDLICVQTCQLFSSENVYIEPQKSARDL